jgi:hypothetical protein
MTRASLFNRFAQAVALLCGLASLAACTQTIQGPGASPAATALNLLPEPIKDTTTKDLKATATNFDNAVGVGYTDLADFQACSHLVNQQFGIEIVAGGPSAPPTAKVTNAGLVSGASIVVIDADIAKNALQQGISIPQNCVTAFGEMNLQSIASILGGIKLTFTPAITPAALQSMLKPVVPTPIAPAPTPVTATPTTN